MIHAGLLEQGLRGTVNIRAKSDFDIQIVQGVQCIGVVATARVRHCEWAMTRYALQYLNVLCVFAMLNVARG